MSGGLLAPCLSSDVGCSPMKTAAIVLSGLALLLAASWASGLVGFRYPHIVQGDPLRHPCKVRDVQGTNMVLADGRVIAFHASYPSEFSNELSQSEFEVDVEGRGISGAAIYARHKTKICGTPWAQPIVIPLIRDTVYKQHREMIAFGTYVTTNSQPSAPADGSQPFR